MALLSHMKKEVFFFYRAVHFHGCPYLAIPGETVVMLLVGSRTHTVVLVDWLRGLDVCPFMYGQLVASQLHLKSPSLVAGNTRGLPQDTALSFPCGLVANRPSHPPRLLAGSLHRLGCSPLFPSLHSAPLWPFTLHVIARKLGLRL